jgi:hypothetical protein
VAGFGYALPRNKYACRIIGDSCNWGVGKVKFRLSSDMPEIIAT